MFINRYNRLCLFDLQPVRWILPYAGSIEHHLTPPTFKTKFVLVMVCSKRDSVSPFKHKLIIEI